MGGGQTGKQGESFLVLALFGGKVKVFFWFLPFLGGKMKVKMKEDEGVLVLSPLKLCSTGGTWL